MFATLILLSGGMVQSVLHICPQQGTMLDKDDCGMHQTAVVKDCCKKPGKHTKQLEPIEDCCTDAYLFAVSAKYGSIEFKKINIPIFSIAFAMITPEYAPRFNTIYTPVSDTSPPPDIRQCQGPGLCVWTI